MWGNYSITCCSDDGEGYHTDPDQTLIINNDTLTININNDTTTNTYIA